MAVYRAILSVANLATGLVITHNLNNSSAVLSSATPGGWFTTNQITARAANTTTLTFSDQAPGTGTLTMDVEVNT